MVARTQCSSLPPRVDMNVLPLHLALGRVPDGRRGECMIELLGVHVKDISVPLNRIVVGHHVQVTHPDRRVRRESSRSGEELVEVAGDDHMCGRVSSENSFNECLQKV